MTKTDSTQAFIQWSSLAVFLALLAFALFYVPMNMDEAGIFHTLACFDHPFSSFQLYREACSTQNNIVTPLGLTIARPQFYTGLFHSLLYAPFYFTIHAEWGQYLFGLVYLLAFTFALSRLTENPKQSWPIFLAFFPFVIQFIHDAGPIKFAILTFPLITFLIQKSAEEKGIMRLAYALPIPIIITCATEEKAFYLYLLPGLFFFALAFLAENKKPQLSHIKNALPVTIFMTALTAFGLWCLLFATNQQGIFYIDWLRALAKTDVSVTKWIKTTLDFIIYWPSYAHNYFVLNPGPTSYFLFILLPLNLALYLVIFTLKKERTFFKKPKTIFLFLSFFSTLFVFGMLRNTWAGHHFIFLWVPLIVLMADSLAIIDKKPRILLGILFLSLNVASIMHLTQAQIPVKDARERDAIFAYFNEPKRATSSIVSISSWGAYYIQALYGPKNQLITYTEPYAPDEERTVPVPAGWAKDLLDKSKQTGRALFEVCYDPLCNKEALEQAFGNKLTFKEALPGLHKWHVFEGQNKGAE